MLVASASSHGARTSATHHSSEDHDHHKDSQVATFSIWSACSCNSPPAGASTSEMSQHERMTARQHDSTRQESHRHGPSSPGGELHPASHADGKTRQIERVCTSGGGRRTLHYRNLGQLSAQTPTVSTLFSQRPSCGEAKKTRGEGSAGS